MYICIICGGVKNTNKLLIGNIVEFFWSAQTLNLLGMENVKIQKIQMSNDCKILCSR